MRIGIGVPQLGRFARPSLTREVAVRAERSGIDSLWVLDRLLVPTEPRSRYPAGDGTLPAEQHEALDPIVTLAVAATVTERISVGTDVLVAPWYPPALLARSLATLDQVADGRLIVGLGVGWSRDEFDAVGVPMRHRGARLEEVLEVVSSLWSGETTLTTTREAIAPSQLTVRPIQRPRPPVLLATFTEHGLERVARRADGWLPTGLPLDVMASMWSEVLVRAERYGRDPGALRLVLRSTPHITDVALGSDRAPFTGTHRQITDDVLRARDLGVHELIVDLQADARTPDELVDGTLALTADALSLASV
jgi:probable F420-dependent oxidoreductase